MNMAETHNPVRHLYVHVPFCARICPYCAFYKTRGNAAEIAGFVEALKSEASRISRRFSCAFETISFGGGTPSALSEQQWEKLLPHFSASFALSSLEEWSVEANPGSVSAGKADVLLRGGINRVSLGVQSWDDDLLRLLGREHDARQAQESFRILRTAGFENLSLDLMFALPGQTERQWRDSLARSVDLQPEHISTYCLTYEEDTEFLNRFQRGEFSMEEETEAHFLELAMEILGKAGYEQYEISNYARPGYRSRHNQAYWRGADYLGMGPSAFSTMGNKRWQNVADFREYARRLENDESPVGNIEILTEEMKRTERVALGLRTRDGLPVELFAMSETERLIETGFLQRKAERIFLTRRGRLVADAVAGELL